MAFVIYVTDSLQLAPQSKFLTTRFADMLEEKPVDNRTGDEIALDVIGRLGLKVKE